MSNIPNTSAKCPKCGKIVTAVTAGQVRINAIFDHSYRGISYACPDCQTLLGIQMDPVALKKEIVDELLARLQR